MAPVLQCPDCGEKHPLAQRARPKVRSRARGAVASLKVPGRRRRSAPPAPPAPRRRRGRSGRSGRRRPAGRHRPVPAPRPVPVATRGREPGARRHGRSAADARGAGGRRAGARRALPEVGPPAGRRASVPCRGGCGSSSGSSRCRCRSCSCSSSPARSASSRRTSSPTSSSRTTRRGSGRVARLLPFVALVTAALVQGGVYRVGAPARPAQRPRARARGPERIDASSREPATRYVVGADSGARQRGPGSSARNASTASAASGRANMKPWPLSHCSSCSWQNWSCCSMPSASVFRPSCLPSCTSVRMQRARLGRVADRAHERAVDLQDVDRELTQVRERRVAGAEVVDRDADAELLDRRAAGARSSVGVVHDRGLGELDDERRRGEVRSSSSALRRSRDEVVAVELAGGDVDRHVHVALGAGATPAACRHASSSTQRPTSTISFVSSSSGMNVSGCTMPRVGMVPAQQRLDAEHAARSRARRSAGTRGRTRRVRARRAGRARA